MRARSRIMRTLKGGAEAQVARPAGSERHMARLILWLEIRFSEAGAVPAGGLYGAGYHLRKGKSTRRAEGVAYH
jgi:hypothetical protein